MRLKEKASAFALAFFEHEIARQQDAITDSAGQSVVIAPRLPKKDPPMRVFINCHKDENLGMRMDAITT